FLPPARSVYRPRPAGPSDVQRCRRLTRVNAIDPHEMAWHIDRVRRRHIGCRAGVVTRDIPGGWMTAQPGAPVPEVPSAGADRVFWLTQCEPLVADQVHAALEIARGLGRRRMYFWLAPWACNADVEAMMGRAGIKPW